MLREFEWTRGREHRLVRFLLDHYADKPDVQLEEILEWLDTLQERELLDEMIEKGGGIRNDLVQVIERKGTKTTVSDVAQRIVIFISGKGYAGKTTLADLLKRPGLPYFPLDHFAYLCGTKLCPDAFIRAQAEKLCRNAISTFWNLMVSKGKSKVVMDLLFSAEHGFKPCTALSIIEGYLPPTLREELVRRLKKRGYRVWVLTTE
jgi:hypothetical protein